MTEEEAKEFLAKLMTQINEQDNRSTAFPYFYVIREKVDIFDEYQEVVDHYWRDELFFLTEEEAKYEIESRSYDYGKDARVYLKYMGRAPSNIKLFQAIGALCGVNLREGM